MNNYTKIIKEDLPLFGLKLMLKLLDIETEEEVLGNFK
jgi:hypothetical protein